MGRNNKSIVVIIAVILAISSIVLVGIANAQTIPKPSVPEFTVRYVDNSYDVEPRYAYDPYTGKNVLAENGYHVQNKTVELKIKNQPLTNDIDSNGNVLGMYFMVQTRGYFGGSWYYLDSGYYGPENHYLGPISPNDEYILMVYGIVGNNGTLSLQNLDISDGGKADFRVQAFTGYYTKTSNGMTPFGEHFTYVFTGQTSDWSSPQTITVGESSNQLSPTVPEFPILAVIPLLVAVISATAIMKIKKLTSKQKFLSC